MLSYPLSPQVETDELYAPGADDGVEGYIVQSEGCDSKAGDGVPQTKHVWKSASCSVLRSLLTL